MASKAEREKRLLAAIDAAEETAYGSDEDGDLSKERSQAIDYYLGRNVIPAPEGRSQVRDRSVFETIQWILPSLCRIFANGDDVVELPPIGPDDEEKAKQESQYLNHIILNKNNWFETFLTFATSACLTKNAYILAYREHRKVVEYEKYERQTEEGLAALLADGDVEVIEGNSYPDPDAQPQPIMDPMTGQPAIDPATGQPAMQPPAMLYDVKLRRTKPESKICIKALPPERCKVSERTTSFRLAEDCDYFEYWEDTPISELRKLGLDIDNDIVSDNEAEAEEDVARDQYGEQTWDTDGTPVDPSMRKVRARMIWIRFDHDEDGIAEMQYVLRVGKHVLVREEVSRIPAASTVPLPLPFRHPGLSIADIVMDLQDIKTVILRGGLDNLYLANTPQTAVSDQVNLDDLLVRRPSGIVRVNDGGLPGDHVMPLVTPFVFPQAMEGLEYMDQVRENRTGTNRYFTGIDQNAMNKTATGIQQLSSMAAQRVEQIARIMACSIVDLFSIVHELILKSGHKSEVVQLRGQWVEVDPGQWRKRTDFKISVGFAAGNKDAMVQKLLLISQKQADALTAGIPIVTPENLHATAVELTKAADFAAPDRFWTEPKKIPPKPPQEDPIIQAEKIKSETTIKKTGAELQQKDGEKDKDVTIEKYKIDQDNATKIYIEQLRLQHQSQLESQRREHEAGVEVFRARTASESQDKKLKADHAKLTGEPLDWEEEKGRLGDGLSSLKENLQILTNAYNTLFNGKRRVKRDGKGKAEAVEILGDDGAVVSERRIVRDPSGAIAGAE